MESPSTHNDRSFMRSFMSPDDSFPIDDIQNSVKKRKEELQAMRSQLEERQKHNQLIRENLKDKHNIISVTSDLVMS